MLRPTKNACRSRRRCVLQKTRSNSAVSNNARSVMWTWMPTQAWCWAEVRSTTPQRRKAKSSSESSKKSALWSPRSSTVTTRFWVRATASAPSALRSERPWAMNSQKKQGWSNCSSQRLEPTILSFVACRQRFHHLLGTKKPFPSCLRQPPCSSPAWPARRKCFASRTTSTPPSFTLNSPRKRWRRACGFMLTWDTST